MSPNLHPQISHSECECSRLPKMAFKKVLAQTVRELKREVNKLRLPEIEVKVQEATSNEPWGPHGSLMTEIADASDNPNEMQMIMGTILKRLTDTGENWRHVYKGLTVMEFLIANGSKEIVEEIIHSMSHIEPLKEFQFVEQPSGRDQGINVRKKAETLLLLISDPNRIMDVRKKATANKNKYQGIGNPAPEASTGRLEDDDWQKPMQNWSQQNQQHNPYDHRQGHDGHHEDDHGNHGGAAQLGGGVAQFGGGAGQHGKAGRGPPPSYEDAMKYAKPVQSGSSQQATSYGFDDFDPRGAPSCTDCGGSDYNENEFGSTNFVSAGPASFVRQPSSTNPSASTISNFAPAAGGALPPIQGSSDKLDLYKAGGSSFKPRSR